MKCQHCGNDSLFFTKNQIRMSAEQYYTGDGKSHSNSAMDDGFETVKISKYVYCSDCRKRVCLTKDFIPSLRGNVNDNRHQNGKF